MIAASEANDKIAHRAMDEERIGEGDQISYFSNAICYK